MLKTGSTEDRKALIESLQKNTQALNERLDNAAKVIGQVQKSIGEFPRSEGRCRISRSF